MAPPARALVQCTPAETRRSDLKAPLWACLRRRDGLAEIGEELVGVFLRDPVDEAAAELGELAADLGLDVVGHAGAGLGVGKMHLGAALGEARDAALPLAGDGVAVRWVDVREGDLALEGRLHGPDRDLR